MEHKKATQPTKVQGRWRNLWLLAFASLIDGVEGGVLGVLFTVMRSALGLTTASLGVISATSKLVGAVAGPLWGIAGDRYSRKSILVFATGVWGIWTIAIGLSQNYTQLLILIAIAAVGSAATVP
ncbi:MAG: MFS transporter, partial [Candidatus Promineifilaceae bacterium]